VQEVLEQTGHTKRHYKFCPPGLSSGSSLAWACSPTDSHTQVYKHLQRFRRKSTPSRSALGEARKGLGIAPLRYLASRVVCLLGTPQDAGGFSTGVGLMALDGFVVDVPDMPDNARIFGRPKSGRAEGAFPQARILSLCEVGTMCSTST